MQWSDRLVTSHAIASCLAAAVAAPALARRAAATHLDAATPKETPVARRRWYLGSMHRGCRDA